MTEALDPESLEAAAFHAWVAIGELLTEPQAKLPGDSRLELTQVYQLLGAALEREKQRRPSPPAPSPD